MKKILIRKNYYECNNSETYLYTITKYNCKNIFGDITIIPNILMISNFLIIKSLYSIYTIDKTIEYYKYDGIYNSKILDINKYPGFKIPYLSITENQYIEIKIYT